MDFDSLIPYIDLIVYAFITLTGLYITTYVKERSKNGVLKKRNAELELIKANHQRELENLKKEHQLDIEKRKYQYQNKKEQYLQFFKLLDSFHTNSHSSMQEKFAPINDEFMKNYLNAVTKNDQKGQNKAATVFSKKMGSLTMEANKELTRIKQETNTIRIIASDEILVTLDQLENCYNNLFEVSMQMMQDLPKQIVRRDETAMKKKQNKLEVMGQEAIVLKDLLIKKMREELREI